MATVTDNANRTAHLLALMKKGDDAFNARDFAAVDTVHHPDMVAYIPGNAQPIYGSVAHAAPLILVTTAGKRECSADRSCFIRSRSLRKSRRCSTWDFRRTWPRTMPTPSR